MTTEEEPEDDYPELKLTIDKYDLENEWAEHPSMVHSWAENAANALLQFDEAKQKLELAKAETDREIRSSPKDFDLEKITDKSVESTVITQPEYQAALRNLNSARHDLKIADAAMIGLEHRRKGLALMVELWIRKYYSNKEPQTDSEEGKDFETHEVRTRGQRRQKQMQANSIDDLDLDELAPDHFDEELEDNKINFDEEFDDD